ncbi:MAG: hypothetical protein LBB74_07400 [Chitinispirillales bacterium]|jgi:hypothetical protein|nr:hypothetical protein [Chitinispirillales bacterium]
MAGMFVADTGLMPMDLRDVVEQEQFDSFYESNGVNAVEDKIALLKKSMKIRAIRYDEDETLEEMLDGLEASALLGYWKAYREV